MKKEVAKLWVKELRSGYWKQEKNFLEHSEHYCVFGVLANIAATFGICSHGGNKGIGFFDGEMLLVPESVKRWSGLKSVDGYIPQLKFTLIEYNERKNFKELANIIEKHWKEI